MSDLERPQALLKDLGLQDHTRDCNSFT